MKPTPAHNGKGRESPSAGLSSVTERGLGTLARARSQLSQAVGDVLSGSLGALEGRLQNSSWRTAFSGSRNPPVNAERLREVLQRDRALFAANPQPRREIRAAEPPVALARSEPTPNDSTSPSDLASVREPAQSPDSAQSDETSQISKVVRGPEGPEAQSEVVREAARMAESVREAARRDGLQTTPPGPVTAPAAAGPAVLPASSAPSARPASEPIRTRTMARLLASQGHRNRALAIYDDLIARDGGADASLQAEAEALRNQPV